jgi:hypothetical protein
MHHGYLDSIVQTITPFVLPRKRTKKSSVGKSSNVESVEEFCEHLQERDDYYLPYN